MAANHTFIIGHSATVENEISAKGSSPLLKLSDTDTSNLQHTLSSSAGLVFSADINNVEASSTIDFAVDGSTVGTLGPTGNLTLTSASSPILSLTDTTNTVTASVYAQDDDVFYGSATNHPTIIGSNNTTAITVDTSQNVAVSNNFGVSGTISSGDININQDDTPSISFIKQSTSDVLASIDISTDTGSGGKLSISTKRDGNTALERLTINDDGLVTISGSLTVSSLTVNGALSTISTTNTIISDNIIELNNGAATNAKDIGLLMERGSTGDNAFIGWDESATEFVVATTTGTADSSTLTLADANFRGNEIRTTYASNAGGTVRNVYQSASAPTAGDGQVGDLWITYI